MKNKKKYLAWKRRLFDIIQISNTSDMPSKVFDIFEEDAWPEKFPIVDFYLRECAVHPIYGVVPDHLKLMDVGKLDSLDEADSFIATL